MAKSPEEAEATMIQNLKEKTGKTLEEWIQVARGSKLSKHRQVVDFLQEKHGLTYGYANLVTHRASQSDDQPPPGGDDLVEAQYSGAKAALRPIYNALLAQVGEFGGDVEVSPKKGYVSLRRSKQFALIQPSTATRVDVGINLKGVPPTDRLEPSGSFNAMVSHRVRLAERAEVDQELVSWLRKAYDAS